MWNDRYKLELLERRMNRSENVLLMMTQNACSQSVDSLSGAGIDEDWAQAKVLKLVMNFTQSRVILEDQLHALQQEFIDLQAESELVSRNYGQSCRTAEGAMQSLAVLQEQQRAHETKVNRLEAENNRLELKVNHIDAENKRLCMQQLAMGVSEADDQGCVGQSGAYVVIRSVDE